MPRMRKTLGIVCASIVALNAAPAFAQLSEVASLQQANPRDVMAGAYDPVHDVYFVVEARRTLSLHGRFINRSGATVRTIELMNYSSSVAGSAQWGNASVGDTPSLADMDGDGRADPIVWRRTTSEWFWLKSSAGSSPSLAGYVNMALR